MSDTRHDELRPRPDRDAVQHEQLPHPREAGTRDRGTPRTTTATNSRPVSLADSARTSGPGDLPALHRDRHPSSWGVGPWPVQTECPPDRSAVWPGPVRRALRAVYLRLNPAQADDRWPAREDPPSGAGRPPETGR
jgi:hypothetical protein